MSESFFSLTPSQLSYFGHPESFYQLSDNSPSHNTESQKNTQWGLKESDTTEQLNWMEPDLS